MINYVNVLNMGWIFSLSRFVNDIKQVQRVKDELMDKAPTKWGLGRVGVCPLLVY